MDIIERKRKRLAVRPGLLKNSRVRRMLDMSFTEDVVPMRSTDDSCDIRKESEEKSNLASVNIEIEAERQEPSCSTYIAQNNDENVNMVRIADSEELEELFPQVVFEYAPNSDSFDSDIFIKSYQKSNKKQNKNQPGFLKQEFLAETNTLNHINTVPEFLQIPETVDNITKPNLTHAVSGLVTPSSLVATCKQKISTPDSFKEVLVAVRNLNKIPKENYISYDDGLQSSLNNTVQNVETKNIDSVSETLKKTINIHAQSAKELIKPQRCSTSRSKKTQSDNANGLESAEEKVCVKENPIQTANDINFIASQFTVYINDESFIRHDEQITTKKSRKKMRDESSWQVKKSKMLKNLGKPYCSRTTGKERRGKVMGDPCGCKKKCYEKLDTIERIAIFNYYWSLGNHERQWDYILKFVKTKPKRMALVDSKRPRTQTLEYNLPKNLNTENVVTVCKKMFLQTLDINDKIVYTALDKQEMESVKDLRGCHSNRPKKVDDHTIKSIIDHINQFPRKESHYLRKQIKREYLDEKLNRVQMYRLYLNWIKDQPFYQNIKPASLRFYCHIFNTKFNIGFFHPKKDLCVTCSLFEQADNKRKEQLKQEYENHLKNKELVRNIKNIEKETSNPIEKTVASFDLQKVLSVPQSEVGVFHYKRKYPVYNFTVYNILTKDGYCYMWHAQIAKRGANEIASCLWIFLQNEASRGIREISFYSDNCSGQNRNRFVFGLYAYASKMLQVKIIHRFLQKGHTQNEGDSMHSCIERNKKNQVVYVPDEMYSIVRNAKVNGKKYIVKEMTQEDFLNFKRLVELAKNWDKDTAGNKVSWSKIKEIFVDPQNPEIINFKYEFDEEEPKRVNTNGNYRKGRQNRTAQSESNQVLPVLTQLYNGPLSISRNLYKDLISLCNGNNIPRHYHSFYKRLHPEPISADAQSTDSEND